jgi:hypothetical protein
MKQDQTSEREDWGPEPASRTIINRLIALDPSQANELWTRFNSLENSITRAEVERRIADAEAQRKTALPAQPLETVLRANQQSNTLTRKRIAAECARIEAETKARKEAERKAKWEEDEEERRADEAKRKAQHELGAKLYAQALAHAIEQKWAWSQQERVLRNDPLGLYGPMTLASGDER